MTLHVSWRVLLKLVWLVLKIPKFEKEAFVYIVKLNYRDILKTTSVPTSGGISGSAWPTVVVSDEGRSGGGKHVNE